MYHFKNILLLALVAGAVGMMASCVKDNEEIVDYDVALQFNPAIYTQAKAAFSGTYPQGVPFGVTASSLPVESSWEQAGAGAEAFLVDEKVSDESGKWLPQSKCNWPHVTRNLSVIAYSPYGAASKCSLTEGVVFNNVNTVEAQTDLLYTEPVTDLHKGVYGGVVALPFKHALSTINVKIKNLVDSMDQIVIKEIRIPEIRYKGTFKSFPQAGWELEEDLTQLTFYSGSHDSTQAPTPIGSTFLIIPQQLDTHFEVDFNYYTQAGTYLEMSLSTRDVETMLLPGRSYTYTLSVGIDEVKFLLEVIDSHLQ